ncbi:MAG: hypothetical protein CL886_08710 [Dehalococcoidia bacterium]|nr:hypothetical protein [Dehalococcoidia bacterium]
MTGYSEISSIAHLLRRAGFGASREDLEHYSDMGYEATVEELLNPELQPDYEDDLAYRYVPYYRMGTGIPSYQCYWMYRMISTRRPLEEKMTLFWHHVFATSHSKLNRNPQMNKQLKLLRSFAMGNFRTILIEISKDPAMIYWLDNCENHNGAPNENYGRELLELFSMGVGMDQEFNYSEDDVKECARAFTGWTMAPQLPRYPYGDYCWDFEYRTDDHDHGEKSFLGETGRFNGDDIVDIIVRQPATARFLSRHLYNFFVSDEPQVPSWQTTEPQDPEAIKALEEEYFRSNGDVRSMLRILFNSDFFKNASYKKVKSPAELIAGVMRLVDDYTTPKPNSHEIAFAAAYMGQDLLNPPTVEGWHTGKEWIDSGALVERVNFAADRVGDINMPGVRRIVSRLAAYGPVMDADTLLDHSLELAGPVEVSSDRRTELMTYLEKYKEIKCGTSEEMKNFESIVTGLLRLIVASREFQFA